MDKFRITIWEGWSRTIEVDLPANSTRQQVLQSEVVREYVHAFPTRCGMANLGYRPEETDWKVENLTSTKKLELEGATTKYLQQWDNRQLPSIVYEYCDYLKRHPDYMTGLKSDDALRKAGIVYYQIAEGLDCSTIFAANDKDIAWFADHGIQLMS